MPRVTHTPPIPQRIPARLDVSSSAASSAGGRARPSSPPAAGAGGSESPGICREITRGRPTRPDKARATLAPERRARRLALVDAQCRRRSSRYAYIAPAGLSIRGTQFVNAIARTPGGRPVPPRAVRLERVDEQCRRLGA